jgi:hypothetical protein
MVLDPFTSLSLACAVCQFLDFSGTLFSKSRKIYKSTTGYDDDTDTVLGITKDLRSLTEKLKAPVDPNSLPPEEAELVNLGDKCKRTADELLLVLDDLQDSKSSRWSSFRAALKTIWAQDRIDDMTRKLESYRSQLILRLTIMQRLVIKTAQCVEDVNKVSPPEVETCVSWIHYSISTTCSELGWRHLSKK